MTTYTSVFGSDTIPSADSAFVAVTLTANTQFYWPDQATGPNLMADIMDVSTTGSYALILPEASLVSVGRTITLNNLSAFTILVQNASGGAVGSIVAGGVQSLSH